MWFSKFVLGLFALVFALVGLAFGLLFVFCLGLYLLWHGLSTSILVSGGMCLGCIIIAQVALRRVGAKGREGVGGSNPTQLPEPAESLLVLPIPGGAHKGSGQGKMQ